MTHPVLVVPFVGNVLIVHEPPADFAPPPPEEWAQVPHFTAACGTPMGDLAGYGELDVARLSEGLGDVTLVYCRSCYAMGPPP